MLLIGPIALLFWLVGAAPANAEPISAILVGMVLAKTAAGFATAVAITTFALTMIASLAISYVASALMRPSSSKAGGGATPQASSLGSNFNVRQAAGPSQVVYGRRRVAGTYGFMHLVQNNQGLNFVLLLADHECDAVESILIGDNYYTFPDAFDGDGFLIDYGGTFIRVRVHLGSDNQAADQDLIDDVAAYGGTSDIWGPDHRLRGICYLYIRLQFGPSPSPGDPNGTAPLFSDGIPNFTAVIRGKKVYDPRTGLTAWSANSALIAADYLCDSRLGFGADYATSVNEVALIAAANACDEDVDIIGGGTENRYECNLVFATSETLQTVLGWILGTMHGEAPYDGEAWNIQAGVYQTPTLPFTDDDLRGPMTVSTLVSQRDLFSAVKGTFIDPNQLWQEVDFPAVVSAAFAAADGRTIYKDIVLPGTTSASMAQRIAKIDLLMARNQLSVKAPSNLSAWLCQAGNNIMRNSTRWGWSSKVFKVRKCEFAAEEGEGGPVLGVNLELTGITSSVYSWDTSEEQLVTDMPATTLPNIRDVGSPTNLAVTENLYSTLEGGGVKTRADLTWAASPDAFALQYEVSYKLHAESDFITLPRVTSTSFSITDLTPGLYDFRVAAVNHLLAVSPPITTTYELTGIGAPPQGVEGLSVMTAGGTAILRWDTPADIAIRINGGVEFRHAPVTSGATWATSTPIGERINGNINQALLPLKAGTYLAKFFIRLAGGVLQYSSVPATVYTAQNALNAFSTLDTQTEDPTFGGTHTQTEVSSSKLRMIAGKNVGTYDWSAVINNGAVEKCRITVATTAAVTSRSDLIDNWEDVDSRPSWDTTVSGHEGTVLTYISTTNDDPTGSPTWTTFRLIDSAEFSCWGAKFRTELWSLDPSWNVEIQSLSAVSEEIA